VETLDALRLVVQFFTRALDVALAFLRAIGGFNPVVRSSRLFLSLKRSRALCLFVLAASLS